MGEIWKPNDCSKLKLKVKKRSSLSGKVLKSDPLSPLSNNLGGRVGKNVKTAKRKNPFQCDSVRLKLAKCKEATSENKENELPSFKLNHNRPNFTLKPAHGEVDAGVIIQTTDGKSEFPQNYRTFNCQGKREGFPTDWSLKTKIKFKSDAPFLWCTNLKSNVASRGTVKFIRCLNVPHPEGVTNKEIDLRVNFVKNLSYWRHPDLPCIPSFPLTESENHAIEGSFTNICKDLNMREKIMDTWRHSFQSVFTLARCGFCPYFYMCCQKFSCLFISSGVSDKEMMAIVTPTTKGLRGLLHKEGIEYKMPHLKDDDSNNNEHLEDDENGVDTDEDFLSSIGLNKKHFSSIEKHRFASELSQLNYVDNRAQSTLLVKDCHVNALFNFFLNSDVIVAHSGAWQGVPPTLLAPVAFEGASLQKLQFTQGPVKVPHKGGLKQVNCLDISGPVLPSHFYSICQLVKEANKSFEATICTNAQSNAFNCMPDNQQTTFHDDQISELGISRSCLEYLGHASLDNNEAMSHLQFSDGLFEWNV